MSKFCFSDRFPTRSGDALPGFVVRLLDKDTGSVAPIYSDESGTPIPNNEVVQDELGNFTLFADYGIYSVECLNPLTRERVGFRRYVNMDGNDATLRDDISTPTGGSLVSYAFAFTGATTRTVTDKLQEMVSVKDFGAVGDGVADDTAEIQAALNSGADYIWVPDGIYKISDALSVPSGTTLEGAGATAIIRQTGTNKRILRIESRTDVTIRGLYLENNLTSQGNPTVGGAAGGDGILIANSQRVKVLGCTIDKVGLTTYTGAAAGVSIYISTDVVVDGNIFTGLGKTSVGADVEFAYFSKRVTVSNNLSVSENNAFVSGPAVGVAPTDNLHHIITGNIATRRDDSAARSGIIASYASMPAYVLIANNILENWPSNGIYISAATIGTGDTAGVVISGNSVRYCGGNNQMPGIESGIYLAGRAGTICTGNVVSYSGYKSDGTLRTTAIAGILVSGAARAITVAGNTVMLGAGPGINLRNWGTLVQESVTVTGNTIFDNIGSGIFVDPTQVGGIMRDILISGNNISGPNVDAHGVEIALSNGAAPPLRLLITNNMIAGKLTSSTKDGIRANCSTLPGWAVRGNHISLWANGAQFTSGALPDKEIGLVCPIEGNTFTSNTVAVAVPNTAGYSLLFGNTFVSNGASASPAGTVLIGSRIGARTFRVGRAATPPGGTWEVGQMIDFTTPAVGGRTGAVCTVAGTPGTWVETGHLHHVNSKTQDWPSLTTGTQSTTTVTLANAQLGDFVEVSMNLDLQGMNLWGYVSSAGVVTAVLRNDTGSTIDLASGTLRARLVKQ